MNNTIRSRFDYISDRYKDNIAIISGGESVTYHELKEKEALLCKNLSEYDVKVGDRVGILCKEKFNWIVSMLALVTMGAVYVPLDVKNPPEYIEQLSNSVDMQLILTDEDIKFSFVNTKNILSLKNLENEYQLKDLEPDSLAYIMFTSGTTGIPKGVGVTHDNILNLTVESNYVKLDETVRMLQTGAPTFDASTFDVWGTLLNGGTLILIENQRITDLKYLGNVICNYKVTTMWLTSPLFSIVAEKKPETFEGVKELIVGGDVVNPDHVDRVLDACNEITVFNGYGPTECTTFSTVYKISVKNNGQVIPIGKPIKNVCVYVLDEDLNPVKDGEVGELYIGGKGVAKGYVNNKQLNEERFIDNPFEGGKLYKTGDLVREDINKNLHFLGRQDRQVKIRGYRIELDAVEIFLKRIPEIEKAVTCIVSNLQGGKEICCCITLKAGREISTELIRKKFAEVAPSHIVLSQIQIIDDLPINKNGKIDYKQIKELFEVGSVNENEKIDISNFETKEELLMADIIKKRTGAEIDNAMVSFFELGVDSLTAVYLASDISEQFNVEINAVDILMNATIKDLLTFINLQPKEIIENENKETSLKNKLPILNQQKPIFIDFTVNQESVKYNIPMLIKMPKEIDADLLIDALNKLVSRHDALRVKFSIEGIDIFQTIENEVDFEVERIHGTPDLENLIRPFNLKEELPFRFSIIEGDNDRWLFMDFHHIIVDGASLKLIIRDLNDLYYRGGKEKLISNYADLVEEALSNYKNNEEKSNEYYQKYFADYHEMNELPLDEVQKENYSHKNNCYKFKVNEEMTLRLRKWCEKNSMTTFEGLMITYAGFLHTITAGNDVVFATPSRQYSDLNNDVVAMLTNTLWIYSHVNDNESINSYMVKFIRNLREVQKFSDASVDFIYGLRNKKGAIKPSLTDTLIAYHSWQDTNSELFGIPVKAKPISPMDGMFMLNMQLFDNKSYLEVEWEYMDDAFLQDTMASLGEMFKLTLKCLTEKDLNKYNSINELVICSM